MSWKSIELQVALSRTQDAGKLQEQMGKQHQHFQGSLAENQLKQEKLKRKRVNDFERVKLLKNKKEDNHPVLKEDEKKKGSKPLKKGEHPYLGMKIDFNG